MRPQFITGCGIFLLSGAALAYEVILVRLMAMTRFHHLAFMVLSLVLLAYGISGVVLAYLRTRLLRAFRAWFCLLAVLFAVGAVLCFQVSQHIPLRPDQWLWSPFEALYLVLLYLVLSLPFLAAACGVGLAYCSTKTSAGFVYRADLLGAATGSLGGLAALWLPEAYGLWVPWCAGLAAAALIQLPDRKRLGAALLLLLLMGVGFHPRQAVRLEPSPDKPLSVALGADGASTLADSFSPLGRITITRNRVAPFRQAPGLSLAFSGAVDAQWGAFIDGETFAPLPPYATTSDVLAYLDFLPEALAFQLLSRPQVLVLEGPAFDHLARALRHNAAGVHVVAVNPRWRTLAGRKDLARLEKYFTSPGVKLTVGAPRGILRTDDRFYSLIILTAPAGSALAADHLHTVQAIAEALARLQPGGFLAVSGPSDLPPRSGLRLLTTAAEALRRSGVIDPASHIIFIRSLRTVHLLIKNIPLNAEEIARVRTFCSELRFDPVWFPGILATEANRWNRLDTPLFHDSARQLLGPAPDGFQQRYKFDVSPLFDDRPYFSCRVKPAAMMELFSLRGSGGLGLFSYAEPVLAATLAQALLACLLAVWLPLRRFRPAGKQTRQGLIYVMLGAGFMLVEMAVMEKMAVFLNEPVLAVGLTLAVFLAMAGLGGGLSTRLSSSGARALQHAGLAAVLVSGAVAVYLLALPRILEALLGQPLVVRMALAPVFVSPLALAMGLPFPLAVTALKYTTTESVPWAWGLNGCGALIGPVAGMALAVFCGISTVLAAAAVCYAVVFAATRIGGST
jgi:hypothetical protein